MHKRKINCPPSTFIANLKIGKKRAFFSALIVGILIAFLPVIHGKIFPSYYGERTSHVVPVAIAPQENKPSKTALSKGKFLVAGRSMRDPRFMETVLLLIEYGPQGAMGLIINRPTDVKLSSIFPEMEGLKTRTDTIYVGGPVDIRRFFFLMRSQSRPDESLHVFEDIYISSSEKLFRQMINGSETGKKFHVYIGYAGWSPQQLDQEVLRGDWHIMQGDAKAVFEKKSSEVWPEFIRQSPKLWI